MLPPCKLKNVFSYLLLNQRKMPHPADIPTGTGASQLNTHAVKCHFMHIIFKSLLTLTLLLLHSVRTEQHKFSFLFSFPKVSWKQYKLFCHFYIATEVQKERCISVQALKKHAVLPHNWFPRPCTKHHSKKPPHMYFYKIGDHKYVLYLWVDWLATEMTQAAVKGSSRSLFEEFPQTQIW